MVSFELGKEIKKEVYQNQISIKTSFFRNNVVCDFEFTY